MPSKGTVIPFDATERRQRAERGQRRCEQRALRQISAVAEAEKRRIGQALGVSAAEMETNGARLYYHGEALLAIEAAYQESTAAGREALLAALFEYHDLGYGVGLQDGPCTFQRGKV